MVNAVRFCFIAIGVATQIVAHTSANAQITFTVPSQSIYFRQPLILYPNGATILGRAVENANDVQQQFQDTSQYTANQRQLWLADQENKARYLQQQNEQRQRYQQQVQVQQQQQQFQQQYGQANSTPSYVPSRPAISSSRQNEYVQQWNSQYQSRQATVNQWGQAPLPSPYYQQARRVCSNGQRTWNC